MDLKNIIVNSLNQDDGIWYGPKGGYWSNLETSKSNNYLKDIKILGSRNTVKKHFPQHEDVIFSSKRMGGLATMTFSENDMVLDAGCMWGGISVPLAKTKASIIAIEQTVESLLLLAQRKREEKLVNLHIICADLNKIEFKDKVFDKVIVNGVLEWIPEEGEIEVGKFIKKENRILNNIQLLFKGYEKTKSPRSKQEDFLRNTYKSLKPNGVLYLAIENRYDLSYFLGLPEVHCGIRFISLLPRCMQNFLSLVLRGRKFRNWTYSQKELKKLLQAAGFSKIKFYYAFPDYRIPELVLSDKGMKFFRHWLPISRKTFLGKIFSRLVRLVKTFIYRELKLGFLAPSFIIHACK